MGKKQTNKTKQCIIYNGFDMPQISFTIMLKKYTGIILGTRHTAL